MFAGFEIVKRFLNERRKVRDQKRANVTIFSPVRGTVSLNGKPLEGVRIVQKCHFSWKGSDDSREVFTDENGSFFFEELRAYMGIGRFLPHEPVIPQSIEAEYNGETFLLWNYMKRSYEPMSELHSLEELDQLDTPLMRAYREGAILIDADLSQREEIYQKVDYSTGFISTANLNLPYQAACNNALKLVAEKQEELEKVVADYFVQHPDYFTCLEEEDLTEFEVEKYADYRGATVTGVESVSFSGHLELHKFESWYTSDTCQLLLNGELIVKVKTRDTREIGARLWISAAQFDFNDKISFHPDSYSLGVNPSNINPLDEA